MAAPKKRYRVTTRLGEHLVAYGNQILVEDSGIVTIMHQRDTVAVFNRPDKILVEDANG